MVISRVNPTKIRDSRGRTKEWIFFFKNMVLRGMFGRKRKDLTEGWRKLQNKVLSN